MIDWRRLWRATPAAAGDPIQHGAFVVLNSNALDPYWQTLAIGGASRGGTSALALLLRLAGVPFGEVHPLTHEAPEFKDLIGERRLRRAALAEALQLRAANGRWGFKHPHVVCHLPYLQHVLDDPVFVIAVRNPLSIARSKINRRQPLPTGFTLVGSFEQAVAFYDRLVRAMPKLTRPLLVVEYEKAVAAPQAFAAELTAALHLQLDAATLERAAAGITGAGYRTIEAVDSVPRSA